MRYRDESGQRWADIIDMLTMHPEERRKVEEAIELLEETFAARRNGWRPIAAREKDERAKKAAAKAAAGSQAPGAVDQR